MLCLLTCRRTLLTHTYIQVRGDLGGGRGWGGRGGQAVVHRGGGLWLINWFCNSRWYTPDHGLSLYEADAADIFKPCLS
jgi:hypothetical protein